MRIISKFKESYDYMLGYGIDNNLVYERETKESFLNVKNCFDSDSVFNFCIMNRKVSVLDIDYKLVILCIGSKCFPMIINRERDNVFYNYDDYKDFIIKSKGVIKKKFDFIFQKNDLSPFENEKINIEIGCPVSVIFPNGSDEWSAITNPYLDDYSAYSIMNGFDIFQEISSFLSARLADKENSRDDISDIHKHQSKGFTDYSFKTRPKI